MLKKITFVLVSMITLASTAAASDDLFNELANNKGANIADASVELEDIEFDIDVDALAENAEGEDETDAVEACFRRFGYRSWGRSYGYRCFRPVYHSYSYYRPLLCQPVYRTYSYCAPIVTHYWGCY